MILTFSKKEFETLIKSGVKIHTIRVDKYNRWKVGRKIHFWLGNPRNTRSKNKPHSFAIGEVLKIEQIQIDFACDVVYIGNNRLDKIEQLNELAVNDGFENWLQMKKWFENDSGNFFGKLIFWKNFEIN